jgi:hypothetical protein
MNVSKLPLAEISLRPPGARIDKGEDLQADIGILAFRNRQIGDERIKRRIDPANCRGYTARSSLPQPLLRVDWSRDQA